MWLLGCIIALLLCVGCAAVPAAPAPTPSPAPTPTPGIASLVEGMSLEQQVGQLFLVQHPIDAPIEELQSYHLGGFLFFGYDFAGESPESMAEKLDGYQQAAQIPMLMAVDEEGGQVTRVSCHPQYRSAPFPSPRELYAQGGLEAILAAETEKCQLLRSLGLNVNLGPVCDISTQRQAFLYPRSLGQSPDVTAEFAAAMVDYMTRQSMGSALKHFPGYGNNADTHRGIAVDHRSLAELEQADLLPFAAGIQAGCGAVLMSHTIVGCLDQQLPVSLSPEAHRYLRETMGFQGVIVTDDLAMNAITDTYELGEAAVLAVLAGNDLLCTSDYKLQYQAVLDAARSGRIPAEQLSQAVTRVLQWKQDLGLLSY